MTKAADLVLTNAEVHTLADPDETQAAVAIRDGEIVRVDSSYEVDFLVGVDTQVVDLDGRVVLPGLIDAHTHLPQVGKFTVHADLRPADGPSDVVDALRKRGAETTEGWVIGYGYDESTWASGDLELDDLNGVSTEQPVVAFREDLHTAVVNDVVLDEYGDDFPESDVDGGKLVEAAVERLHELTEPDREEMRELVRAGQKQANELGVTAVHDMVRQSEAPAVYRALDTAGELSLRVRLNYWADHLDALDELGLRTNHGSNMVQMGAVKTFTDGTFGGRTAKLTEPYADGDDTGQWVVPPEELSEIVARADDLDLQVCAHAIGDAAIEAVLDVYEAEADDPGASRHRVEHCELATDAQIERMADLGVISSMQPNFLKWAGENSLYMDRLGPERYAQLDRLARHLDAGVPLAFGSDCMPLDPLLGIHHAVNPPLDEQALTVTQALRAYTAGAAYAGFQEDRLGTLEPGAAADVTVLDASPWDHPEAIRDIDVAMTLVDGEVVYDGRDE